MEPLGGPKNQSLRNSQGDDFRTIISAYEDAAKRLLPKTDMTQMETAISMIPDPIVRVVLKEFFAENKRLKHENDQLRAAFKNLSIGQAPAASEVTTYATTPGTHISLMLSLASLGAIRKGLNSDRLRERGLTITKSGATEDTIWRQIFPPGFATGLQSLIDAL